MKGLFPWAKTLGASLEEHPFLGSPLPRFSNTKHDILDFSCCPLSRILQKFRFEFHLRSSPFAFRGYGWSVDQLITSLLATPCWWDPTRSKQLSTVAILGFQFGLYHVVVPLALHVVSALHHCSLTLNLAYCIFCGCFFFVYFFSQVHWVSLSLQTPSCICRHPKNSDRFLIHLRWFLSRGFREY